MKKLILFLSIGIFSALYIFAQTPYDNFAPEQSIKSMIELPEMQFNIVNRDSNGEINRIEFDKNTLSLNLFDENDNVIKTIAFNPNDKKFLTMDPLAEKYYSISPYAYCANNPLRYVDPNGRTIQVYDYANDQRIAYEWRDYQGAWGFYDNNNALYEGSNTFIGQLSEALTMLMNGGNTGYKLVSSLSEMTDVVTIAQGRNVFDEKSSIIGWDSNNASNIPTTNGADTNVPFVSLGHEMAHAWDYTQRTANTNTWINGDTYGTKDIPNSEIYSTHMENKIRAENGFQSRTHYFINPNNMGAGPRIIDSKGRSIYYNKNSITNYRSVRAKNRFKY